MHGDSCALEFRGGEVSHVAWRIIDVRGGRFAPEICAWCRCDVKGGVRRRLGERGCINRCQLHRARRVM